MDKRHLKDEKEVLSHDASRSQESRQEEAMAKIIEKSKKNLSYLSLTNLSRMAVDKSERRERILESRSTVQMQQPRSPLDVRN